MASINYAAKEISVKIVYYGPGLSGKTTNLQVIHRKVPPEYKSDMVSLATETDRTLFFDFLPLDLGKIKGFSTKFQLYTVPGQVYYNATRKLVLRGVDGVVFVADSSPDKIQENLESFQNLEENLAEYGYKKETVPIIIQYNKRDLPNALSIDELQMHCNKYNLPWTEAVANKGIGVFDSLKLVSKIVIDYLNKKYSRPAKPGVSPSAPKAPNTLNQPQPQQYTSQQNSAQMPQIKTPQQPSGGFQQQFAKPQPIMPQPQARPVPQQPPRPPMQQPMGNPIQQQRPRTAPMQQSFNSQPQQPVQQKPVQPRPPIQPDQPDFVSQPVRPAPLRQQPRPSSPIQQNQFPGNNQYSQPPMQQYDYQQQDTFEQAQSADDHSFELEMPSGGGEESYYNYGSIDVSAPNQYQQGQVQNNPDLQDPNQFQGQSYDEITIDMDSNPQQYDTGNKTDLDMEIEKYQREIEEKQRRMRSQPPVPPRPQSAFQQPAQRQAPQQMMPPQNQQHGFASNHAAPAEEDYDVYNVEISSHSQQDQQQNQTEQADDSDEAMFFTSVDTDRQKRPARRPINPRIKQQKGFLSKFFNKEDPE